MKAKKANIAAVYPLRFLQQALLFHSQQDTVDQGFLQVQCEIKGKVKLEAFKKAWKQTIRRHEFLRAAILWENLEKPVQVVHKEVSLPFTFLDWSEIAEAEQKEKLEGIRKTDAEEKLDLTKSPLLRISLIKLAEDKHFLLWTCHHILADGWSASIILKDLLALYDSNFNGNNEDNLPAIPSYRSYLSWIQNQDKTKAAAFWTDLLEDFETPTLVGNPKHSQRKKAGKFEYEALKLSEAESDKLRDFSQKNRITLNTLMQGIWAILLRQYSGKDDIAFGTIVSGRSIVLPNAEFMAGMYMNVLPLRIKVYRKEFISDWLQNLQLQQAKTREFEYVDLDEIFDSNSSSHGKLFFDSLVVFENFPSDKISGGGISIENFKSGLTSNYPLTLAMRPRKKIEAYLKYDSSLISEQQIAWFTKNLKNLFQAMFENKATTLEELINYTDPIVIDDIRDQAIESEINSGEYAAPTNDLELKLMSIWEALLNRQPIGVTEDFFDIGGTSISAIRLFMEIEKQFGKKLQPISLLKHRNIESLSRLILDEGEEETLSSLVPLRASGSRPPIYCLHAGGGHVFFYKDLAKYLGDDQPVYAIQRLGLDDLTQATQNIKTMATDYLKEIRKVQPVGPYSLLGYCFSTSVVWEMAEQLLNIGETVSVLAMIDSPPHYTDRRTKEEKLDRIVRKLQNFDLSFVKTAWEGKIKHPVKQKWNYLTGDEDKKDHQRVMSALNSNAKSYKWKPLKVKVTLIRSSEMMNFPEQNEAVKEWDDLALKGVDTFAVDGIHELLFEEPVVQKLAKQLEKCFEKANS